MPSVLEKKERARTVQRKMIISRFSDKCRRIRLFVPCKLLVTYLPLITYIVNPLLTPPSPTVWLFTSNTFEVELNRDQGLLRERGGAFLVSEDDGISSLFIKKKKLECKVDKLRYKKLEVIKGLCNNCQEVGWEMSFKGEIIMSCPSPRSQKQN